jgi:hypothetical protein
MGQPTTRRHYDGKGTFHSTAAEVERLCRCFLDCLLLSHYPAYKACRGGSPGDARGHRFTHSGLWRVDGCVLRVKLRCVANASCSREKQLDALVVVR